MAIFRAKGGPTQCQYSATNKVLIECNQIIVELMTQHYYIVYILASDTQNDNTFQILFQHFFFLWSFFVISFPADCTQSCSLYMRKQQLQISFSKCYSCAIQLTPSCSTEPLFCVSVWGGTLLINVCGVCIVQVSVCGALHNPQEVLSFHQRSLKSVLSALVIQIATSSSRAYDRDTRRGGGLSFSLLDNFQS